MRKALRKKTLQKKTFLEGALLAVQACLVVFLLCSCELFFSEPPKGKIYMASIGISYKDTAGAGELACTVSDSDAMAGAFEALAAREGRAFECFRFNDHDYTPGSAGFPTKEKIESKISEFAAEAASDGGSSLLVVFLSCHGFGGDGLRREDIVYSSSVAYQNECGPVTIGFSDDGVKTAVMWNARDFLDVVNQFTGKKCIIADFCFSGSLIAENNVTVDTTIYATPKNSVSLFSDLLFADTDVEQPPDIYVLAASKPYEKSYEDGEAGLLTGGVLYAIGWDGDAIGGRIPALSMGQITLSDIADKAQEYIYDSDCSGKGYQHMKLTGGADDLVLFDFL
ncbi:MAG: caspase family protein [Sphaerochaetaceae bacterium]